MGDHVYGQCRRFPRHPKYGYPSVEEGRDYCGEWKMVRREAKDSKEYHNALIREREIVLNPQLAQCLDCVYFKEDFDSIEERKSRHGI